MTEPAHEPARQPAHDLPSARALEPAGELPRARGLEPAPPPPTASPPRAREPAVAADVAAPPLAPRGFSTRGARASRRREVVRAPAAPAGELSGLRLLLDQLDALLRDPTLALWLRGIATRLAGGLRGIAAGAGTALRRLVGVRLRLPPFPRRLLLALLALTLPLALVGLLTAGDDERGGTAATRAPAAADGAGAGADAGTLAGAGMPDLLSGPADPRPVAVALVLDRTYDTPTLQRELRTLGAWLREHHAPGTRVTLIDARTARASRPLRAVELAPAAPAVARSSTAAAIRAALGAGGRRLLVTLGSAAPAPGSAQALRLTARRGASTAAGVPVGRGRRSSATIDDRRPQALASSVARALMAMSGQRERR